uniref:Uncharacterized protein n=1 Tax=Corethron hystrix TaxID=216773 RepID=A0A7S1FNQ7_9STRA|mmetsp:Transcript_16366/g.36821  ORF Transcript_16366/g.36821 Transcript_16366/m.36821 type:complete len:110 (+) Transcript_16366:262-591(+)
MNGELPHALSHLISPHFPYHPVHHCCFELTITLLGISLFLDPSYPALSSIVGQPLVIVLVENDKTHLFVMYFVDYLPPLTGSICIRGYHWGDMWDDDVKRKDVPSIYFG